jgi:hypothetical protein
VAEDPQSPLTQLHKRIIQGTNAIIVFKIKTKPKFLSMIGVRRFKSKLFHFLITHDTLVDTWKFTGKGEA